MTTFAAQISAASPALSVQGLEAFHGRAQVLRGVSFDVAAGEVLCLLGRNGAGKTSTLRAIMGTLRASAGRVSVGGVATTGLAAHLIPRLGLAHAPQGRRLFGEMTVRENLEIGLGVGRERGGGTAELARALELFPILETRMEQRAGALSGGEQTMLCVARAICAAPRVILMDEPTEGLMPAAVAVIRAAAARLAEDGAAIVLVEQRVQAVLSVARRAAFMDRGRITAIHEAAELRADPALVERYMGVG